MTDPTPTLPPDLRDAIDTEDWEKVEELWLEALEARPFPTPVLLEARRRMWKAGQKTRALTLLELLAEALEQAGDDAGALAALRELVRLTDKPGAALLERLEATFARTRQGSPTLQAVLERHRLPDSRRPLEALEHMETWLDHDVGTVVEVEGQGVGRVVDLNLELENIKVDLGGSRPVSVPFGAASRFLERLAEGDFRRRKVEEPETLRRLVAEDPGEALAQLLASLDEPSDVATLRVALDGLVEPDAWSSWWTKARKDPRVVTSGSGSRLRYAVQASGDAAVDALMSQLEAAPPRDRLAVARRLAERGGEAARQAAQVLADSLGEVRESDPGVAWETATLLAGLPGGEEVAAACHRRLVDEASPLELLDGIQDRSARLDALEAIRHADPDAWATRWGQWLLREEHPQILDRIAAELDQRGADEILEQALETVFRGHHQHAAQFVWACESMVRDDAPEALRARLTPSLLEKLPDVLQRKEFSSLRSRGKTLLDGGQAAVRVILAAATPQQAERFLGRLQRLDAVEPHRGRVVEQAVAQARGREAAEVEVPQLVASREAVEEQRRNLKQLLEVEIPRTLKGINAAAAEGDLRENFEYHMLRDRQELQSARAARLQRDLARVRILEPGTANTEAVNVGTVVLFEPVDDGDPAAPVTILGAWDADPDRRVFAADTELAEGLLGRKIGDEVQLEGRRVRIADIQAWRG